MYNLLMVADPTYWTENGERELEWPRFLVYTEEGIKSDYLPLNQDRIAQLASHPTLFATEFSTNAFNRKGLEPGFAHIGYVRNIKRNLDTITFSYVFDPQYQQISMNIIASIAQELDIDIKNNENYRSHWAIKDIDLLNILAENGIHKIPNPSVQISHTTFDLQSETAVKENKKPKVFLVHGRDESLKNEVARWLQKIGMDEIILHEQASVGRTIITKFQEISESIDFAVVLLSPDDIGGLGQEELKPRARQNVVFEMGFFIGLLGSKRVAALLSSSELEIPSDYAGVVYISHDPGGAWKIALAREFKALGLEFNLNNGI